MLTAHRTDRESLWQKPCQSVSIYDPSYGKTAHLLDSPRLVTIETHTREPPMRCWIRDQCWIWSDSRPLGVHDLFVRHVHVWIFSLPCLLFTWCNSVVIWVKQIHVTWLWIPMNYIHFSQFKHHAQQWYVYVMASTLFFLSAYSKKKKTD